MRAPSGRAVARSATAVQPFAHPPSGVGESRPLGGERAAVTDTRGGDPDVPPAAREARAPRRRRSHSPARVLLPGAVPAIAADGDEPVILRVGTTQDLDASNPFHTYLVVGYEAFQLTYNLLVEFDENADPAPGFADTWERSRRPRDLPHPRGHAVVRRRAGDVRRTSATRGASPLDAIEDESLHRRGLPRPGPQGRRA